MYLMVFARFKDAKTIEVSYADGSTELVTADHILIATGGRPSIPAVKGAEYGIDSNGVFALNELPKRVAVVGAGYIAVELGLGCLIARQRNTFICAPTCPIA